MIGSIVLWLLWAVIGFASVKVAAVAVVARRRRRYRRCLARIERLEIELGYRKGPTTYADVLMGLRPGAAWPTYIEHGLPRVFAPEGAIRKTQWTDDEIEQQHIARGGKPMVWGY